jgi:hypothetical protein
MSWTIQYFFYRARIWKGHIDKPGVSFKLGHLEYANRQMAMWSAFAEKARLVFNPLLDSAVLMT